LPGSASCPDLILNLRKPVGWSSFDVVRLVKRHIHGGKVGHAGTLDPFAEGVLLVCTGRETKKISLLVDSQKEYYARIRLGVETDTLDVSGAIVGRLAWKALDLEQVRRIAGRFVGEIEQVPPSFSAIQIDGQRLYKLARAGVQKTAKPRLITIHALAVSQVTPVWMDFSVVCSKGTYIRSLARDLARELGTVGFLSHLSRTRIGSYASRDSLEVTALPQYIKNRLV
jgi:tRNA pseudouridine55 synthase